MYRNALRGPRRETVGSVLRRFDDGQREHGPRYRPGLAKPSVEDAPGGLTDVDGHWICRLSVYSQYDVDLPAAAQTRRQRDIYLIQSLEARLWASV